MAQENKKIIFIFASGQWNEHSSAVSMDWDEDFLDPQDPTKLLLAFAQAKKEVGNQKPVCAIDSEGSMIARTIDLGLITVAASRSSGTIPEETLSAIADKI